MLPKVYVQHRLFMCQSKFLKEAGFNEIVPVNYNFQNMIIVDTCLLIREGKYIVLQTSSCGCGPQPYIKTSLLHEEVKWHESKFCKRLLHSNNKKDAELANQDIVSTVYGIEKALSEREKVFILDALKDHLGTGLIINFF